MLCEYQRSSHIIYVVRPLSMTGVISAKQTGLLKDNRVSHRHRRCLKMSKRRYSGDIIRYKTKKTKSIYLNQFLPVRTSFGVDPIQINSSLLHFEGAKRLVNVPALSFRRRRITCNLHGSLLRNTTSYVYYILDNFLSGQTMPIFPHYYKEISRSSQRQT